MTLLRTTGTHKSDIQTTLMRDGQSKGRSDNLIVTTVYGGKNECGGENRNELLNRVYRMSLTDEVSAAFAPEEAASSASTSSAGL